MDFEWEVRTAPLNFSGSETALVVKASRAIPLNPPFKEGGYNNCGCEKLATRRPWLGVAGSIPGRRLGGLASDGREPWCPCRTANRWSWSPSAFAWCRRHRRGLTPSARLALQPLQRLGSFLKPLSAKNICSPAVKTNSAPHSEHFRTLSWNSMSRSPWPSSSRGKGAPCTIGPGYRIPRSGGNRGTASLGLRVRAATQPQLLCLTGSTSRKCGAEA